MTDETTRLPAGDNEPVEPADPGAEPEDAAEPLIDPPDVADSFDEPLLELAAPDWSIYSPDSSGQDIDAALAAVAALSEPVTRQEAEEIALDAAPRKRASAYAPQLAMPPLSRLKRGQLGSVVPALLLIGLGAWLTLTTTSGGSIDPQILTVAIIGGAALALVAYWLGAGRWSRGTLLFGLLIALTLALGVAMLQSVSFYPLIFAALGVGLIGAGVLARPVERRAFIPGLLLILGGAAGLLESLGIVPPIQLSAATVMLPVVAVLIVILLILPRLRRR